MIIMTDFDTSDAQKNEGITQRKAAKLAFEAAFNPCSGVTSETIRKNKVLECFKNIFPSRAILSVAPQASDAQLNVKDLNRVVGTIKRKASHKLVFGKALNGNMLLAIALEYAETLSQPQTSLILPGSKNTYYGSLSVLFQAFNRVSEEEMQRMSDTVLAEFEAELCQSVNDLTMPLSEMALLKIKNQLQDKYRTRLRKDLAEIATFDEVVHETEKIEERMRQIFDQKRQVNYSQGYYIAVGHLKQLFTQEFGDDTSTQQISAADIKAKWLNLSNVFKDAEGSDSRAKWDVFAECLIRLPAEEHSRYVDYSQVECERALDLADETDNMIGTIEGQRDEGVAPADLVND